MVKDRKRGLIYLALLCCGLLYMGFLILPEVITGCDNDSIIVQLDPASIRTRRIKRNIDFTDKDILTGPRLAKDAHSVPTQVHNSTLNVNLWSTKEKGERKLLPMAPGQGVLANYEVLINQPYLCHKVDYEDEAQIVNYKPSGGYHILLAILVPSHPANKRRRDAIRETWGRIAKDFDLGTEQVIVMFVLGLPRDYDEYQRVKKEAKLYQDLVVYDFVDDYRNLTIKSLLGMYWTSVYCNNARYVMKADDDVYINVPFVIRELKQYHPKELILGSLNSRSPVKRYGQWKVEVNVYPFPMFPPYCSGCLYIMSADVVEKLYNISDINEPHKLIPVEDVYITGILAEKLGVKCQHHERFPTWINVPSLRFLQRYLKGEILGLHGVDWIRMYSIWQMINKCQNCSLDSNEANMWFSRLLNTNNVYE